MIEKHHLLSDIKEASLFVKQLEAFQANLIKIELVLERNIIDFLQSQIYFANVQQAIIHRGAQFFD